MIISKRLFDLVFAAMLLIAFMPIMIILAAAIRMFLGHPVIFIQLRPGLKDKPFNLYKFRTMTDKRGSSGELLSDAERMTGFGRFLRSTSLDELPSLWNVIKGEMSVVGPRPLLMEYLPLYSPDQARRHDVKPGLTGWAQINGRNAITWDEKFSLDIWYIENWTLWLDIKIILMTIKKVMMRTDINAEGEVTMPKFTGNKT